MSQFAFSDSMAAMPNPSTTNYGNMDTTKLLQRLQSAEEMIETYRLGKLQLVNDLEQGFSKVCEFMQEQYNKSPDEEVTARWFKHIIADLRTSCEKEAAENRETFVSAPVEPMDAEESINISNFTESDANFLDNMDLGLSGTGHSFSPRGGYSSSIPTTYGNSVAAFPSTCKPAPKTMVRQSKTKPKTLRTQGEENVVQLVKVKQKRRGVIKCIHFSVLYVIKVLLVPVGCGTTTNTCTMQLRKVDREISHRRMLKVQRAIKLEVGQKNLELR